ncbi:MAG: peptidase dimerization protein [Opitutus sp.]|nr:peptidase dimerization protein [Opitutus sp.]
MSAAIQGGDKFDAVAFARGLMDLESTTGSEAACGRKLAADLRALGWQVREQPVAGDRFNLLATVGEPRVTFSTHFDCVPPFFPSRVEGGRLVGRGACDAKGILAAQVAAAERLRARGETRVALLFVVGEERGSDGAKAANTLPNSSRFLINGEPTDLRLGTATRGGLRVRLHAAGQAAHSGYPELGESATEKLLDCLETLRRAEWPADPVLGRTHFNIGLLSGGVAPNVIPPQAQAELFFRTVGDAAVIRRRVAELVGARVRIEETAHVPLVRLHTVPGFGTAVFSYATDVPFLGNWGRPLLYGPGSIHVAHTDREFLDLAELRAAIDGNVRLATELLAQG